MLVYKIYESRNEESFRKICEMLERNGIRYRIRTEDIHGRNALDFKMAANLSAQPVVMYQIYTDKKGYQWYQDHLK